MSFSKKPGNSTGLSRRSVLRTVAASGAIGLQSNLAGDDKNEKGNEEQSNGAKGTILAYVGAYTPNGLGIHQFRVDPGSGKLTPMTVFPANNPSWISFDPTKHFLYAVNEISNFNGTTTGSVTAYSVNQTTGALTVLNVVSSGGSGPAHCSVHPSGKFVFVANYGGGNVAVLPVKSDGSLMNASDIVSDTSACSPACPVGSTHAVKAPPGSFAVSGHDAPHAHMIQSDPGGNFVVVNDLGLDRTIVWRLDKVNGKLLDPKSVSSSVGAGPRHFVFHPNGHWFYSLNEEASTLTFMLYDANSGTLSPQTEVSTLPAEFVGTNFTSEVIIDSDGRYIYCLNRLHDSIAIFEVQGSGRPNLIDEEWTRGDYPRSCGIDPTGNFLYSCNQRGDSVTIYRIDGDGRHLKFTNQYAAVGSPAVITFLVV